MAGSTHGLYLPMMILNLTSDEKVLHTVGVLMRLHMETSDVSSTANLFS